MTYQFKKFIEDTRPWVLIQYGEGKPGLIWRPKSFKQKIFKRFVEGLIYVGGAIITLAIIWGVYIMLWSKQGGM